MNNDSRSPDRSTTPDVNNRPEMEDSRRGQGADSKKQEIPGRPFWRRALLVLVIVLTSGAFIFSVLPKGAFSTDLTQIGAGSPVAVLAYEPAHPAAMYVMELMREVRGDAEGVLFLAASTGTPEGLEFLRRHNMPPAGTLLFFDARGHYRTALVMPESAEAIHAVASELVSEN